MSFQNPTNGQFEILSSSELTSKTRVKVVDVLGKIIYETELVNGKTQIDLNDQADGVYQVIVTSGENKLVKKIVLTK